VRQSTLIKVALGLATAALFAILFIRSARSVGAQPYTIAQAELRGWTVALDPQPDASGIVLALWPRATLAPPLFSQIFSRSGLSLSGPNPVAMPLVLKTEFDRAGIGNAWRPEALEQVARENGVEAMQPKPTCLANRRMSEPGSTREVFFVRFDFPPLAALRTAIAARLDAGGGFNPAGLSPVLIIAATDGNFRSWLPLEGDAREDCVAPIDVR
jgi:hypothetical protein